MGQKPSKPDPTRHVEVIGAGLSRTGSLSQTLAFERLCGGPGFHGASNWLYGEDRKGKIRLEIGTDKADTTRSGQAVVRRSSGQECRR